MNYLEELQKLINGYDWFYEMSDDHRVWMTGQANDQKIHSLIQRVGFDVFWKMWSEKVENASRKYANPVEFMETYLHRFE